MAHRYTRDPLSATERLCVRCQATKPISEFVVQRGRWPCAYCKACGAAANREYRARNRDRLRAESRARYGDKERAASRERARRLAVPIHRVCDWCGAAFIRQRASKLCSDDCRWHWNQARQNAKPNILTRSTRLRILNRDGWHCYLCAEPISRTAVYPDRESGTADHVYPRSAGGSDEDWNLRAAHARCNRKKANRMAGFTLAYTADGEPWLLVDNEYFAA